VEDVAKSLGTLAHVTALRRLAVGPFGRDMSLLSLSELEARKGAQGLEALDSLLLPVDHAVLHWPKAALTGDSAWYFTRGQAVFLPGAPSAGKLRVYGDGRFLGVGEMQSDGRLAPKRLMNLPPDAPGTAVLP